MILKQETIKSWFSGMKSSINAEVVQPFANAEQIIWKYNQAIQHNSLTQKGWERLLAQSDDSLKAYLTSIKGTTASMTGYTTSLQGNITGFKKVSLAINQYNSLATAGIQKQNEFSSAVAMTNGQLGNYLRGLNGSKASLGGYASSLVGATAKTVALQVATMALNSVLSMGLITVIQLAIQGFHKLINAAKQASEVADEVFSESNNKVQQNKEELKSLDELIAKYKELKASGELDVEGRKEVKELQNDIADLVGVQAKNLDLVNGKLDEEIKKLNEISKKEAKNAYETATANYNNSKKAVENATGDASILFVDGYAYVGDMEKEAEKILQDAGFVDYYMRGGRRQYGGRGVGNNGFSTIVFDTYDKEGNILKGAQEKADYLQSMIDVLEQNGQRATDLYAGLIKQRDNYLRYIDDQQNAANSLVDSWITYSQFSNETLLKIDVDSVESFEHYRQKMIDEIQKDEIISQMIADEILSKDDLETVINDYMATSINFSSWYEQWIKGVQNTLSNPETTISFSEVFNSSDFSEHKEELLELAKAGELTPETLESTEEYKTLLSQTGLSAESTKDKIYDLLSVQERLAGAHNGLDNLANSYEEFKELNFVTAQTLEELPAVFKSLEGYDLFSKIVGNPQSGTDAIQQAFNDIVKEYLIFIQTIDPEPLISGSIEEQQRAKDTYIANLKKMGITNAEEVVNQLSLLDYAEAEYVKYLENKNGVDLEYIESSASYNSQLINSMADGYKTDYDNWVDSLAEKQKAYNAYLAVLESTNNAWSNSSGRNTFKIDEEKLSNGSYREDELFAQGLDSATVQKIMEVQSKYKLALKESEDFKNKLKTNYMFDADIKTIFSPKDSGSGSGSSDDTTFDWIETLVDNQTNALDKLNEEIDDTYSNWGTRSNKVKKAISDTETAINLLTQAEKAYIDEANKANLTDSEKSLVREGAIDIDTLSNDNPLKKELEHYEEYYNKAKDVSEKLTQLKKDKQELQVNGELDLVKSRTDADIDMYDAEIQSLETQLDALSLKGKFGQSSYYKEMISWNDKKISALREQESALQNAMKYVNKDSEAYDGLNSQLLDIQNNIAELENQTIEYNNEIRNLNWEIFDYLEESISRITDEADYLIELLSNEDLFNDKGNMTKNADATLALHFSNIDAYMQKAKDYKEEIKDLEGQLATGGKEVLDKYNERVNAHQDVILAAQQEKDAILDLVENSYQKQLDYLNEIIDKKKESLNAEKDLYNYEKSIKQQVKEISSLEKQLMAYQNDNSEVGKSKVQQIMLDLETARESLEETEMDKNIEEREKLLDTLSSEYEQWINEKLENSDELLTSIRDSLAPDGEIVNTLKEIAGKNNTFVSDELTSSISDGANSSINSYLGKIIELLGGDDSFFGNAGSKIKGYASGTKRSGKELAWLNENGAEIIRTKDGALLKPLDNSMVFNNESSKRLWEFSQNPSAFLEKMGMNNIIQPIFNVPKLPNIERVSNQTPVNNITHMEVVLPNVTNYDDFMNRMQNDKRFDNIVTASMNSKMTGSNSLSKFRF